MYSTERKRRCCVLARVPVPEPVAIAFDENAKCERFLNELVRPAVHPEDVELLQKFAGSTCSATTGRNGC